MKRVLRSTRLSRQNAILARELPSWLTTTLLLAAAGSLLWLELHRPLRRRVEPKARHDLRNLAMATGSALAIRWTERPLTLRLTQFVERQRVGVVKKLNLPPALEVLVALVLLDYSLYLWHVLTHRVAFLWRVHRVHHADRDLEASTALRFHFLEMVLSVPWRCGQIVAIGASPLALSTWQTATLLAILFHHSNVDLPPRLERWLCRLIMTPRMHGIHHSVVLDETNANWSTIFSWPDYLHGSDRLNVPQQAIEIGIPAYRESGELDLAKLLRMPFEELPPLSEREAAFAFERPSRSGSRHDLKA